MDVETSWSEVVTALAAIVINPVDPPRRDGESHPLKLIKTKTRNAGVVERYYQPDKK